MHMLSKINDYAEVCKGWLKIAQIITIFYQKAEKNIKKCFNYKINFCLIRRNSRKLDLKIFIKKKDIARKRSHIFIILLETTTSASAAVCPTPPQSQTPLAPLTHSSC